MPSPNFCVGTPRLVCRLRPVRTMDDAKIFVETRTHDTHQIGSDLKQVLKRLRAKGRMAFILENGIGAVLGTASITETEPAIGVVGIALLPTFHHRGYGRLALRLIEAIAAEHGFIALRADIFDENQVATDLFTKSGFRRYSLFEKPLRVA